MSLGCTPQTGKVLKYNSSVNNQLAHKTVQLTLVKLGNKVRQQRATFLHATNQTDNIKDKTNQEETPLSYRKAQIINNHLGRLNIVLTSTVRATFKKSDLLTTEHTEKKTKLNSKREFSSSCK